MIRSQRTNFNARCKSDALSCDQESCNRCELKLHDKLATGGDTIHKSFIRRIPGLGLQTQEMTEGEGANLKMHGRQKQTSMGFRNICSEILEKKRREYG